MFTDSSLFTASTEDKINFLKKLSKKDWLLLVCIVTGSFFVLLGMTLLVFNGDRVKASSENSSQAIHEQQLYVDVSGAVSQPGIYQVTNSDRVAAAISAAGGLVESADSQYVAESLNLAKTVSDGEKIYIPFKEEDSITVDEKVDGNLSTTIDSLISVNDATASQLDELPKVGSVTAQKIIDGRPYASINELNENKIVSASVWSEISRLIKI